LRIAHKLPLLARRYRRVRVEPVSGMCDLPVVSFLAAPTDFLPDSVYWKRGVIRLLAAYTPEALSHTVWSLEPITHRRSDAPALQSLSANDSSAAASYSGHTVYGSHF
jgi:hypothetical protein